LSTNTGRFLTITGSLALMTILFPSRPSFPSAQ